VYSDQLAEIPTDQLRAAIIEKLEKAKIIEAEHTTDATSRDIVKAKET
jgi:hypothetical protein